MRGTGDVKQLDAALAALAREEAGLRLRLGQVLEALGRGKHFELGFSSLAAYALERCDRSVRWVEAARCLARRLEPLPALRQAVAFGGISWSMAELLASIARPADEERWLEQAEAQTVRAMRVRVLEARSQRRRAASAAFLEPPDLGKNAMENDDIESGAIDGEPIEGGAIEGQEDDEEMCTLTCTVDREEVWLFEATRTLLAQLGSATADAQIEALLAEGQETLLRALPRGELELECANAAIAARHARLQQLRRWRAEAEARCEPIFRSARDEGPTTASPTPGTPDHQRRVDHLCAADAAAQGLASLEGSSARELDGMVRGLSRSLATHELRLARLISEFYRASGWRELGYASEAQYARERLGLSRSSLAARRALALRLEKLTHVAEALGAAQIGVEAAMQVVRVATQGTQVAWVERARQRTLKHLREEVEAALIAVRLSGKVECPPPTDAEMSAFHELERAVLSGSACQDPEVSGHTRQTEGQDEVQPAPSRERKDGARPGPIGETFAGADTCPERPGSASRRAWLEMLGSLAAWLEGDVQTSAARGRGAGSELRTKGRVELRWRVSRANYLWWHELEEQARRWLPSEVSWLGFLCRTVWKAWRHLLGGDIAYGAIYIRDRYRCTSPVCNRRDVTPHHLRFRSAGGSDDASNVATVCTWCHLFGVHGGRIRAAGNADRIRWELGAVDSPCVVVDGRDRVAA